MPPAEMMWLCELGFDGCPFEEDPVWSIEWPNTERNTISTQRCPGDLDNVIGNSYHRRSMCVLAYNY